jgi:uncharacterized protein (DUF305 family)
MTKIDRLMLIPLIALLGLPACRKNEESHSHPATTTTVQTTQSSAPQSNAPYDLQFLDTMTKHHQGAIDMSRMASGKIRHAELAKLAAAIPVDQQKEIEQMRTWRDQWYPGAPVSDNLAMPGMAGSMSMDMNHMQTMQAGPAYDAMFIDMMIPHHEGAVAMSRDALTKAEHAEVRALAQRIIDAQNAEIERMRGWKTQLGK